MAGEIKNSAPPEVSIIIPVLHEAGTINGLLGHLSQLARPDSTALEIIVVDGAPEGDTRKAVRHKDVMTPASRPGRAAQMNHGASLARGRILLFLHADTRLDPEALPALCRAVEDGVEAGAFSLHIDSPSPTVRVISAFGNLRSKVTRVPFGDQGIFILRSAFHALGGYSEIPIMEDLELMRRAKKAGLHIRILAPKARTSARRWQDEGVLRCTLRNWLIRAMYRLGVPAHRLARLYPAASPPGTKDAKP